MLLGVCRQFLSDHHNPIPMVTETFGFHLSDPTPMEVKENCGRVQSDPTALFKNCTCKPQEMPKKLEYNGKEQESCIEFSMLDNALNRSETTAILLILQSNVICWSLAAVKHGVTVCLELKNCNGLHFTFSCL